MDNGFTMLDHPVTQKVLATVVAAGVVAWGGVSYRVAQKVDRNEYRLDQIEKMREDVKTLVTDVGNIKTDVAVLRERSAKPENGHTNHPENGP